MKKVFLVLISVIDENKDTTLLLHKEFGQCDDAVAVGRMAMQVACSEEHSAWKFQCRKDGNMVVEFTR